MRSQVDNKDRSATQDLSGVQITLLANEAPPTAEGGEMILWAHRNGEKVGYCRLLQTHYGDLEIDYLKVEPDYRGQGIATSLLNRAKQVAEREQVWLVGFLDPDGTGLTEAEERAWLMRHGFRRETGYDLTRNHQGPIFHRSQRNAWKKKSVMVWEPDILKPLPCATDASDK